MLAHKFSSQAHLAGIWQEQLAGMLQHIIIIIITIILPHTCWVPQCRAAHTVLLRSPYSRSHKM